MFTIEDIYRAIDRQINSVAMEYNREGVTEGKIKALQDLRRKIFDQLQVYQNQHLADRIHEDELMRSGRLFFQLKKRN
jgi:hypothetical protein